MRMLIPIKHNDINVQDTKETHVSLYIIVNHKIFTCLYLLSSKKSHTYHLDYFLVKWTLEGKMIIWNLFEHNRLKHRSICI